MQQFIKIVGLLMPYSPHRRLLSFWSPSAAIYENCGYINAFKNSHHIQVHVTNS